MDGHKSNSKLASGSLSRSFGRYKTTLKKKAWSVMGCSGTPRNYPHTFTVQYDGNKPTG
ncbi:MAG: hypothetical protein JWM99_2742 [Verrucomicrobiales bacterium]|nr:hypothetical protein [Verrucomicrobiales bacterium]